MTRISFIMPTFNRAHFIVESIRSITAQMGDEDELAIIDDGSTDGTQELLGNLNERFRYYRQVNSGKSAALNRALATTHGQFVWICDDDDILCPGAVATLVKQIDQSRADCVFGRYVRFREKDGHKEEFGTGYWPDLGQGGVTRHVLEDSFIMHNASLVRRSAYDKVGAFDETMLRSLDYDMFVRLALQTRFAYADAVIFQQRKHDGARGPASVLHKASQSDDVWKEFDRRIFERLHREVPVAFFEGMFAADDHALVRRAALLQRAAIMVRHNLGEQAIGDIEAASQISHRALSGLEIDICRRAVAGKHGFSCLLSPPVLARLQALHNTPGSGGLITRAILDGLIWRLRDAVAGARQDARKLIGELDGILGIPQTFLRRVLRRNHANGRAVHIHEIADIAPWMRG